MIEIITFKESQGSLYEEFISQKTSNVFSNKEVCRICLDNLFNTQEQIICDNGHSFHRECYNLQYENKCALCRCYIPVSTIHSPISNTIEYQLEQYMNKVISNEENKYPIYIPIDNIGNEGWWDHLEELENRK